MQNKKYLSLTSRYNIDFFNRLPAPKLGILPGFEAIFSAFENVGYIGELRQRWLEIKKLFKGGLPDVNTLPIAMRAK